MNKFLGFIGRKQNLYPFTFYIGEHPEVHQRSDYRNMLQLVLILIFLLWTIQQWLPDWHGHHWKDLKQKWQRNWNNWWGMSKKYSLFCLKLDACIQWHRCQMKVSKFPIIQRKLWCIVCFWERLALSLFLSWLIIFICLSECPSSHWLDIFITGGIIKQCSR